MGKLLYSVAMSVDGFIAGPGGDMSWLTEIVRRLVESSRGHKKIILYTDPGKEGFYEKLGFRPMNTAMAIWADPAAAVEAGVLR